MIADIHISQEIFAIDLLRVLKSFLEYRRKHFLQLSRPYGDQTEELKVPVKLIIRVKITHSFLQFVSDQFYVIIISYVILQMADK